MIREAGRDALVRIICVVMNVVFALLFAVALWWLMQPQVLIGLGLFGLATIGSLFSNKE